MNFVMFIRATPAGKAMKVRMTGRSRAQKTTADPCFWKSRSARSSSWWEMSTYFPYFSMRGRPPYMPR